MSSPFLFALVLTLLAGLSTAVFHSILELMQQFANMNGLPADAQAYAELPAKFGIELDQAQAGIHSANLSGDTLTVELGSGQYTFVSRK